MMRIRHLPLGCEEHQKKMDHTICLDNSTTRNSYWFVIE